MLRNYKLEARFNNKHNLLYNNMSKQTYYNVI